MGVWFTSPAWALHRPQCFGKCPPAPPWALQWAAGKYPPQCLELLPPTWSRSYKAVFHTFFSSQLGSVLPVRKYLFPEVLLVSLGGSSAVPCGGAVAEPVVSGRGSPALLLTEPHSPRCRHTHTRESGNECQEFGKSSVPGCVPYTIFGRAQEEIENGPWLGKRRPPLSFEVGDGRKGERGSTACQGTADPGVAGGEKANASPAHVWWKN